MMRLLFRRYYEAGQLLRAITHATLCEIELENAIRREMDLLWLEAKSIRPIISDEAFSARLKNLSECVDLLEKGSER